MKKVVVIAIVAVALLALAGGGAAAYFLVFAKKAEQAQFEEPPPVAPVKRPAFIPLEPFSIYVQPEGQPPREVIVVLHLEAPPDNVPEIGAKMHLLRDRYIRELLKGEPLKVPVRFELKDFNEVKVRLRGPTEEVMGKGVVTQVLLLNVISPLK